VTTYAEVIPTDGALTTASESRPYGLATLKELEEQINAAPSTFVVRDLIPEATVNIAVGDSGLGKTAWAYQLGLAVATGVPFIGHETRQGRVVYFDLENGTGQVVEVARRLCAHLGVDSFPGENFFVLTLGDGARKLADIVKQCQPSLVIIDTLRAGWPEAEKDNECAAKLLNMQRSLAREFGTAFILLHHTKKPTHHAFGGSPSLEHGPIMGWLLEAAGARALVNQTDVRIGFDRPKQNDDVALIIKGHAKMRGEFGPIYLERKLDSDGEVTGYCRLSSAGLLTDPHQKETYMKLPAEFTFAQAKANYERSDDPTNKLLQRCIALGILEKVKKGIYRKTGGAST